MAVKRFRAGVIRVITLSDQKMRDLHGGLIEKYIPQIETESVCIEDQPEGVHSLYTKAMAVPKVIKAAGKFKDPDVIIVSCADDPGVPELRELLRIPVVGAGSSAAAFSRLYGKRTGVIGITDYAPEPFERVFGDGIINLGRPEGVKSTLDLMTDKGKSSVIKKAKQLKEAGADSISLVCTGMSTIGVAADIERALDIPVVDPVLAEAVFAYHEILRTKI